MTENLLSAAEISELSELDRTHWLHPLGDLGAGVDAVPQLLFSRGEGAILTDARGLQYIDGMASLWNVNVGYGRTVLAEAAAAQMTELAFSSAYGGFSHAPGVRLAARLAELAPGDLEVTFFATGGAEANDTAYKLARFYWKARGEPEKVKIVSRKRDYHGLTYGATSATGLPNYWNDIGPLTPGFLHAPAPNPYRYDGAQETTPGAHYAAALERVIVEAGPETVAAVIVEPVQGAGGLIVPPVDYLPKVRQVCDRHNALLIADEVITGFGRTGRWFGVQNWGVNPDLMIFAKGVTSGYLPLSGVVMTRDVHQALRSLGGVLQHGFTYSGHPTACAVALRNLRIIEEEGLVERSAELGARLLQGLSSLTDHQIVGDVRGLGLMAGIEFVSDKGTKAQFDESLGVARSIWLAALAEGVILRPLPRDVLAMSPPLVISEAQVDRIVEVLDGAIGKVEVSLTRK